MNLAFFTSIFFFFFFLASWVSNEDKTKFRKLVGQSKDSRVQLLGFEVYLFY